MLQRLIAAVLAVLGLAAIALGVASATAWRPDDTLVATATAGKDGNVVVTAPGVLELGGRVPVTVTARAGGGKKVVLAVGKESDVTGWVGKDAHTVITGLADTKTLTTNEVAAGGTAKPSPDPDGSDLWVQQATGKSSAQLTWTPQPGRWVLLAAGAGAGAAAPSVVLSWPQSVTTPWLVPGIVVGLLALAAGVALFLRLRRREQRGAPESWEPVETGAVPIVTGTGSGPAPDRSPSAQPPVPDDDAPTVLLTRREIREAAALAAAAPAPSVQPRSSERSATASLRTNSLLARLRARGGDAKPGGDDAKPGASTRRGLQPDAATPSAPPRPTTRGISPRGTTPAAAGSAAAVPPISSALPPVRADQGQPAPPVGTPGTAWRKAWGFPGVGDPDTDDSGGDDQTGPDTSRTGKDA